MAVLYDFLEDSVQVQVHVHAQDQTEQRLDQCWSLLDQGVVQQILAVRLAQLAGNIGVLDM